MKVVLFTGMFRLKNKHINQYNKDTTENQTVSMLKCIYLQKS